MLRGSRVQLRGITREDLPRLHTFNNELEVELAGGGDPPEPQSITRLEKEFDQQESGGGRDGPRFAIELNGEMIGHCGLFNLSTTSRTCELGITIGDVNLWGQGYGRESLELLINYAFRYLNYRKVWLHVHAANGRAITAYGACGFQEEGRLRSHVWSDGQYDDLIVMGLLKDEWQSRTSS